MKTPSASAEIFRAKLATRFFYFVILGALIVLIGWQWDVREIKSIFSNYTTMKPNTAIGMLSFAIAGRISLLRSSQKWLQFLSSAFAIFGGCIALFTLLEYLCGFNFHIDEFLYLDPEAHLTRWPPGRLSPITGISFIFIAIAILLDRFTHSGIRKLQQALILITWVISFQALVGYFTGVRYSFGSAFFTQMAIHTSILFVVLCSALLLCHANEGLIREIVGQDIAGKVGRRLLFYAILVPPLVNWLQLTGVRAGFWDADFGVLLRVIGDVVFFSWIAFQTSYRISDQAKKRSVIEERLERNAEELAKAVRAKDDLLAICSHELRTPVTVMKLSTQIFLRDVKKGTSELISRESAHTLVSQFDRQLNRLTRLIEEMLDFSRINGGPLPLNREVFDLTELVSDYAERAQVQFQAANCALVVSPSPPIMGKWDRFRIEQVLANLLSNSLKYGGGKPILIQLEETETNAILSIIDQGLGISKADQERIFEPYERAVSIDNISGLGLGLYISNQIIRAHAGHIEVNSEIGQGSTFKVILPKNDKI